MLISSLDGDCLECIFEALPFRSKGALRATCRAFAEHNRSTWAWLNDYHVRSSLVCDLFAAPLQTVDWVFRHIPHKVWRGDWDMVCAIAHVKGRMDIIQWGWRRRLLGQQ
eukprot:scaffold245622_cov28-Tisochrysis_lutea.AAC.1